MKLFNVRAMRWIELVFKMRRKWFEDGLSKCAITLEYIRFMRGEMVRAHQEQVLHALKPNDEADDEDELNTDEMRQLPLDREGWPDIEESCRVN